MKIGLFFGSFNPIHTGHLIIANYMATQTDLDEVWLIVSPQNPLKQKSSLAPNQSRYYLAQLAIEDNPKLRVSNIEFSLPTPSYTVDTLVVLQEKYPDKEFVLIMGGDNLVTLHKWKNYEILLRDYAIYVYKRPGYELPDYSAKTSIQIFDNVPQMNISATYIRQCIKNKKSIQYLVKDNVYEEILASNLYSK